MAFDEKDNIVSEPKVIESSTIEEIRFIRERGLSGAGILVRVSKRVIKGSRMRVIEGTVPEAKINAGWDSTSKTLKDHLLSIIDNTQF